MSAIIDRIQNNFSPCSKSVGRSFVLNFAVGTVLSGGNPVMGVLIGGNCALATLISAVVKPIFMGMCGYSWGDRPDGLARFGNNIVVLGINMLMMNGVLAGQQLIGMTAIAAALAWNRNDRVDNPEVFMKLETFGAIVIWNYVKPFFPQRVANASIL